MGYADEMLKKMRLSAIGHCARKLGYEVLLPDSEQPIHIAGRENMRFEDGHWHELDVKRRLVDAGALFHHGLMQELEVQWGIVMPNSDMVPVMGHVDGALDTTGIQWDELFRYPPRPPLSATYVLLEVKSMSSGPWWQFVRKGVRQSHPEYFDQVQSYMASSPSKLTWRAGTNSGDVLRIAAYKEIVYNRPESYETEISSTAILIAKNKESGELACEVIESDEGYQDTLKTRWEDALKAVEVGELPTRLHQDPNNYECRGCPFIELCWPDNVTAAQEVVAPSPQLQEAVVKFKNGRELIVEGEGLIEEARPVLVGVVEGLGSYAIQDLIISAYERKSSSYDMKKMEEAFGKEVVERFRKEGKTVVKSIRMRGEK